MSGAASAARAQARFAGVEGSVSASPVKAPVWAGAGAAARSCTRFGPSCTTARRAKAVRNRFSSTAIASGSGLNMEYRKLSLEAFSSSRRTR